MVARRRVRRRTREHPMSYIFDLAVAIVIGAIVLWTLTAVISRFRIPLKDTARISVATVAARRLLTFLAGFFLTGHPTLGLWIGLLLGFVVQAEILHMDLAGKAASFHKPVSM